MKYSETAAQPVPCAKCGAQVAPTLLVCPACGALMHAAELKRLAGEAQLFNVQGDASNEVAAWRSALELLPVGSQQHNQVLAKVQELSKLLDSGNAGKSNGVGGTRPPALPAGTANESSFVRPPPPPGAWGRGVTATSRSAGAKSGIVAVLAVVGMVLLKSKVFLVLLLTKGKLLLVGLTKGSTFFTMLLSFSLYWTLWGWKFAAGLVVGIYIHEMGHVAALRRLGIKATAPMFIPGLGALVRLKQYPADAREDARIGLAGPLWGLGASLAAFAVYFATGSPMWAAITRVNAWINLFNLIPIVPLDGGRGFRALVRWQRFAIAGAFGAGYVATHDGLLVLLGIVAVVMAFRKAEPGPGDKRAFIEYLVLIAGLSALVLVKVPGMR